MSEKTVSNIGGPAEWRERASSLLEFLGLVLGKAREDAITLKAAALAFATMLGLVPLLAAFSFMGTRLVDRNQERLLEALVELLPYSESALTEKIELYMHQAESLQGLGLLAFLLVGVGTLHTIEATINKIWGVGDRLNLRAKVLSLALVLFWGPLLVGSVLSLFVMASRHPTFGALLKDSTLVGALPLLITAMGLTMLYWQVPRVPVRLKWAVLGGSLTAVLLEVLRRSFAYYVSHLNQLSIVYGSFATIVFFMISIQVAWWAILLGTEVTFVAQNFQGLRSGHRVDSQVRGPWVALAVLAQLAAALRRGAPFVSTEDMGSTLGLPPQVLEDSLEPLIDHGFVLVTDSEGLFLARDAHELLVVDVLGCFDRPVDQMMTEGRNDWLPIRSLRQKLHQLRGRELEDIFVVDLIHRAERPIDQS